MIAILLLAFGCPDSPKSIEPFVTHVMGGRKPSPEQLQKIIEKYQMIGGYSPLLDITRRQAIALETNLNSSKRDFRVFVGMRHWHPFIKDILKEISLSGIERIVSIIMAPHYSKISIDGYINAFNDAKSELSINTKISFIYGWYTNSLFLEAVAEEIKKGLSYFKGIDKKDIQIIFSAHSLPKKFMTKDDPYGKQLQETIEGIIRFTGDISWHLGFQSKGMGDFEWLEPTVDFILERLSREGKRYVLLVPIGFVSDHIETLYDIDIYFKGIAESFGMVFHRSGSLNDSPKFIKSLEAIVREHLSAYT
ncbi:MAG: ferrochelatase [Nitrospinota bacterium]